MATPAPVRYTAQAGDSYILIAQRFGVTVEALLEANGRTLATEIYSGDVLVIPPAGGTR